MGEILPQMRACIARPLHFPELSREGELRYSSEGVCYRLPVPIYRARYGYNSYATQGYVGGHKKLPQKVFIKPSTTRNYPS